MTTPERSVEEIVEELRNKILDIETAVRLTYNEKDSDQMINKLLNHYTQTIQAERQRCEEIVESLMLWVEHDSQCILQRNERGGPTEDGGYRTMYAGVWYKSGEEPDCDCGLEEALTQPNNTK